jgi:hypothetical protein
MAAQSTTRTPFSLGDSAHIVGGRIVRVHDNHCPNLYDDTRKCVCTETSYRLIRDSKAGAR